ncbi:hypothetical protein LGK97_18265 [Clostridium sp. CS001]|uniref:hypothetical protein n=1 Tax=Clostridium sp. CS001 TaxID=2880648 RepID=UPI001CF19235|nr:hypothetical protein [Clostridium sp. CS001]MCB2291661.1 hypothetical protein [Clostridium sp. CS001]
MISAIVTFLGEKLLDKTFDGSLDKAIDYVTKQNLVKEFNKLKETIIKELESENQEQSFYEDLHKVILETRIIDLIFNLSYTMTNLTIEERKKCIIDCITEYSKVKGISVYNTLLIQEKILSKFECCFDRINHPSEESRKIINSIISRMANSEEIINGISDKISSDINDIKEELEELRGKLLVGDVDINYLSNLTKSSFENLGVRFNKEFNVDVELTDTLSKFCLTRKTISSLYEDLKEIRSATWQLSCLIDNGLIAKIDLLIENILDEKIFDYNLMKSDFDNFSEKVFKELNKKYEKQTDNLYKSNEYYYFRKLENGNFNLEKYREAFNSCTLIVTGSAGIGKSHSIAHFCNEVFYSDNKLCIFVLGQHLNDLNNPVEMIERTLHIPYTLQRFLDELEKIALFNKTIVPFVVEGINEGRHSEIWRESFAGIISIFERYKWIKLIISIRTTYIEKCLPSDYKEKDNILVVEHKGFENDSIEAVKKFFVFYEISIPTFPILYSEYYNPLFLHTLCKTLKKLDNKRLITEYSSFNDIFEKYIEVIENEIARKMDYNKALKLVKRITDKIIEYSLKNNNRYGIDMGKFYEIVHEATNQFGLNCSTLVQLMFKEGLFYSEIVSYESEEYVQFAYERYHNMLAARYILDNFSTKDEIVISLNNGLLKEYLVKPHSGITEELFIMIPDKFSIEVLSFITEEVAVKNLDNYINSLLWRNKSSILVEDTKELLNKYVVRRKYYSDKFIKTLFILSPVENHPLNILFLQSHLERMPISIRDSFLGDVLYEGYRVNITLRNLVSFCFTSAIFDCSKESIRLMSFMLSWSLASTDLKYRNSVIRALVVLFENNIQLVKVVIINFKVVNDPYIKEGIYCAIYGAVLRSRNFSSEITNIVNDIYNDIFKGDEVYPNILVRDYAREIIEYANINSVEIAFDIEDVRPPYNCGWYENIPTQQEIDDFGYDYRDKNVDRKMFSANQIISSMTTNTGDKHMMYGDFGRYVFEGWVRPWNYHFVEQDLSNIVTKEIFNTLGYDPELHGDFDMMVKSYNRHYNECERIGKKYQRIASYELISKLSDNFPAGEIEYVYSEEYMKKKNNEFEKFLSGLYETSDYTEDTNDDIEKDLTRDEDIVDSDAENEIEEECEDYRKKVFNECPYEGPWQIGVRGIDPTIILNKFTTNGKNYLESIFNIPFISSEEWACCNSSEPKENDILFLKVKDEEFVVLEMYSSWYSGRYRLDERPYQYFVKAIALLVERERVHDLINDEQIKGYCSNKNNYEMHEVYAREYPWSPSYISFKNEIKSDYGDEIKCYIETGVSYHSHNPNPNDEEYEVKSYSMPSEYIIEKLGLKQIEDGKWYDKEGNLIACDMIFEGYKSMLVIHKNSLIKLLEDNNLAILWAMYTEKEGGKCHYSQRKVVGLINNKFEENLFETESWMSRFH